LYSIGFFSRISSFIKQKLLLRDARSKFNLEFEIIEKKTYVSYINGHEINLRSAAFQSKERPPNNNFKNKEKPLNPVAGLLP